MVNYFDVDDNYDLSCEKGFFCSLFWKHFPQNFVENKIWNCISVGNWFCEKLSLCSSIFKVSMLMAHSGTDLQVWDTLEKKCLQILSVGESVTCCSASIGEDAPQGASRYVVAGEPSSLQTVNSASPPWSMTSSGFAEWKCSIFLVFEGRKRERCWCCIENWFYILTCVGLVLSPGVLGVCPSPGVLRVQGSGLRVWGWGPGFRVQNSNLGVVCSGCRILSSRFVVWSLVFMV